MNGIIQTSQKMLSLYSYSFSFFSTGNFTFSKAIYVNLQPVTPPMARPQACALEISGCCTQQRPAASCRSWNETDIDFIKQMESIGGTYHQFPLIEYGSYQIGCRNQRFYFWSYCDFLHVWASGKNKVFGSDTFLIKIMMLIACDRNVNGTYRSTGIEPSITLRM